MTIKELRQPNSAYEFLAFISLIPIIGLFEDSLSKGVHKVVVVTVELVRVAVVGPSAVLVFALTTEAHALELYSSNTASTQQLYHVGDIKSPSICRCTAKGES